ncbi:MAG: aspartate/glutamate racemase family protein [Oscillospiraceae bacterium]|nr:aspartate/glutamate racemase family protein [Oscillospiraceae bacterium]
MNKGAFEMVYGNRTIYGQSIGILMLDTRFPRLPGDIGNATTFSYPVMYKIVEQATVDRVVKEADAGLIEPFVRAGMELIQNGARAIVTSCGFMAIFQKELAQALPVPVFTSSLLQVPLVYSMLKQDQRVGILTADSSSLGERHFRGVGIEQIPMAVAGLQDTYLGDILLHNRTELDEDRARKDMEAAAGHLVKEHPDIGAFVLECTNMPPFAGAVARACGLPVFDIITLTDYVHSALVRKDFRGCL